MKKKERWIFILIGLLMVGCFAIVIVRLANLQIRGTDDYGEIAQSAMTKTISSAGSRGQILDANGALMAYDKKVYNIDFYRDPSSNRDKNGAYSKSIWEIIKLVDSDTGFTPFDFWLAVDENGEWYFDTKTTDESVAANREKMFRNNFYVPKYDVQDIFDRLCYNYKINEIDTADEKLTLEDKLKVLGVWQQMQMNAFNSVPITLAANVSWSTVIEVETRMVSLDGISVSVANQRVYPKGALACHILGYTGSIQNSMDDYLAMGYQRNDQVGIAGIEKSMEQWLTANTSNRRGQTVVEVDRSGKQIRQLSKTDPSDGNTVKLTIDSGLQQVVETELAGIINSIRDYQEGQYRLGSPTWQEENKETLLTYQANDQQIKLAQNGAIVVLDMQCRVLAMASYPDFDPNLFILGMDEDQYQRNVKDDRNPLYNFAIQSAAMPGSVFKMCTALAALSQGVLTVDEQISDEGKFNRYDSSETGGPQCWVGLNNRWKHSNQTIIEGLMHSCNYFFYEISSRLYENGDTLYEFASKLGLASKTNIDLPGETKSVVASQTTLYDPSRPITGYDQDTWRPMLVKTSLKKHLQGVGETYNITYSDERLDKCIKALMDMAVAYDQGDGQSIWLGHIRTILMEELGMSMEMVYRQAVIGDIVQFLNDIKWGGSYAIMTGIGQSITMTTPIAMARYIVAIANGGYVYDVQLIDSIISPDGEVLNSFDEPVLLNDLSDEIGQYIPYIKEGMRGVVDDQTGTASSYFTNFNYTIGGKTGTAETSKLDVENNAWFVSFAPYDDPQIAVVIFIPNGLSGARTSPAAKSIIEYYLDSQVDDTTLVLPAPNGLAQ